MILTPAAFWAAGVYFWYKVRIFLIMKFNSENIETQVKKTRKYPKLMLKTLLAGDINVSAEKNYSLVTGNLID